MNNLLHPTPNGDWDDERIDEQKREQLELAALDAKLQGYEYNGKPVAQMTVAELLLAVVTLIDQLDEAEDIVCGMRDSVQTFVERFEQRIGFSE